MMQGFGWAKNPIVRRMDKLSPEIPITLLYGSRSWVDNSSWETLKQSGSSSYINVQVKNKLIKKRQHFLKLYKIRIFLDSRQ